MKESLVTCGFTDSDVDFIFQIVSAVLLLGNLSFDQMSKEMADIEDSSILGTLSQLLQINQEKFHQALTSKELKVGKRNSIVSLKLQDAENSKVL